MQSRCRNYAKIDRFTPKYSSHTKQADVDKLRTRTGLKTETEVFIVVAQDQCLLIRNYQEKIVLAQNADPVINIQKQLTILYQVARYWHPLNIKHGMTKWTNICIGKSANPTEKKLKERSCNNFMRFTTPTDRTMKN